MSSFVDLCTLEGREGNRSEERGERERERGEEGGLRRERDHRCPRASRLSVSKSRFF